MGSVKLFEDTRTLSRIDLAAWFHELASQLESGRDLSFGEAGTAGHVAVADETVRELEIEQSKDGSKTKLEIEIEWTGANPAALEAESADIEAERPQTYHGDLLDQARANDDFRRVVVTSQHTQVVLMTIPSGGEIGSEVHAGVDQIFIGIEGNGRLVLEGVERPFTQGDAVVVPQGARHNFVNYGPEPLRLVTVYGPPAHRPGTIHHTKADADLDEADLPRPS